MFKEYYCKKKAMRHHIRATLKLIFLDLKLKVTKTFPTFYHVKNVSYSCRSIESKESAYPSLNSC